MFDKMSMFKKLRNDVRKLSAELYGDGVDIVAKPVGDHMRMHMVEDGEASPVIELHHAQNTRGVNMLVVRSSFNGRIESTYVQADARVILGLLVAA